MIKDKTLKTLEFDKIMERVARLAAFSGGKELAQEMIPTVDLDEARAWQAETAEVVKMLDEGSAYGLQGVRDVREVALNAQRAVIIEPHILLDIRYTLRRGGIIKRNLNKLKGQYPLMTDIADEIDELQALQDVIETSIDDNGDIKDSASARLAIIRRDLKASHDKIQSKLNSILNRSSYQQYLQDRMIVQRSGRYVIPIKADFKGKIRGVVHDSSSSGATLFIEPLDTVELNNKWRELQIEEEKEIRRILADLTALVGDASEAICRTVEVLSYLDFTLAKAHYARETASIKPRLVGFKADKHSKVSIAHPGSTVAFRGARHPLLDPESVVPLDIDYGADTWVLVVTGPNTGGKTVSLKTVGLLALMAQVGLHVPADEAEISVFEGVFADIGDEQSIEQSLSTFSSHMTNIIDILHECDERSLVILDEVGAGTDPAEGSALARALLNRLREQRVTTMVSTHHPELKIYAVETTGVRNASVEFNLDTLAPTYRLIVGLPGRSNALAIATRLGLDETIIDDARQLVATEELVADDLLDEIQRTRHEITQQRDEIQGLRDSLALERHKLQERLDHIEDERRDVIRTARRNAENELEEFNKELKRLRAEMRQASLPVERVQALQASAETMSEWTKAPLDDDDQVQQLENVDWSPRLGDTVFLDTLNSEGTIVELDDKEALVQVGTLRVRAKYSDIRKRNRAERREDEVRNRNTVKKVQATQLPKIESPGLDLDLRGHRVEESLEKLDYYIDAAYLSGLPFGRIIHGKGTGKLRQAVRDYVHQHALISKVEGAKPNEGGSGVTIIYLVPQA
ncbi:MAG: endonuclease MutS2 [Anaerolineae bacterium]